MVVTDAGYYGVEVIRALIEANTYNSVCMLAK
jgi:hypothetical protein